MKPASAHRPAKWLAALLVIGLGSSAALAHSKLKAASPASGSVLPRSPAAVTLTFNEAARLTAVTVENGDAAARKLTFAPGDSDMTYKVNGPALQAGTNEIKWKALSKDGHPIDGVVTYVIKPGVKATSPTPSVGHNAHN